ncbi:hypothetical protein FHR32_002093 [Streptosporangium album]|uniref:Uncharacterized protein n=1 Tax=Streptosporangium album TaxID=47479 RepID=A0A7W7RT84_9ACTN|nr:hypothetical protein [Streptosporangium album]MBB4937788.1 hypothetical protein [Streptosporangium album]
MWEKLGFESFSDYVDFTFTLAHGRWAEYGFKSADEAADYLLALHRGAEIPPPHLRSRVPAEQETLLLTDDVAA